MTAMTATDAKNRFGEMLELARSQPVRIQKNGRDVAVVLSAEEYAVLKEQAGSVKIRPLVDKLLERSIERRKSLYEALAR
jgi:prevent-host-death family protein